MLKRLRSGFQSNVGLFYAVEAALVGLFFIQALRFLVGALYARIGSASLAPAVDPNSVDPSILGLVDSSTVNADLSLLVAMLLLPLLSLVLGRLPILLLVGAVITALGRYMMASGTDYAGVQGVLISAEVPGAAIALGGSLLYITMLVRHRATMLPFMLILALGADQVFRAFGNTLDPSWGPNYADTQIVLSIIVVLLAALNQWLQQTNLGDLSVSPDRGIMTIWGGIGLGALLFLQLSLLALPNAIARRTSFDYAIVVPVLIAATLIPLLPWVRSGARRFIGLFDSSVRGWVWMLIIMLLVVLGTRFSGILASTALVLGQVAVSMLLWWLFRSQAQKELNLTGLWVILGMGVFGVLTVFDIFTYEYAFVQDFSAQLDFLNPTLPSLLTGFRGLGFVVLLFAVFLAVLSMTQAQRRIAWSGHANWRVSIGLLLVIGGATAAGTLAARPPVVQGLVNPDSLRVGTYNIHSGYNEFYFYDLEMMARTIVFGGANVVLLQEVEAGRMTSFGVDQPLWLARRLAALDRNLGMDVRFYPTNEGLQGLAVLSQVEIAFDDGVLLESQGIQTGLQRVQIVPDGNVITIYNTWLEPLLDTGVGSSVEDQEASQRNQLNELLLTINANNPDGRLGRMILGGTFNNIPDSDVIRTLADTIGFIDHFAGRQSELVSTFRRTGITARLDYLWTTVSNNFQVVASDVINDRSRQSIPRQASDHMLAVIEISLR